MIPLELEISSLKVSLICIINEENQRKSRLQQRENLDEKRINALIVYQSIIKREYGKKIKPMEF